MPQNIVTGQKVAPGKVERARELRQRMTPEERLLWQHLRANRLHGFHFRRQQVIAGFIVDFYCHAAGLVVEVDGAVHEQQVEADRERDAVLTTRGLRVLRVKNAQVSMDLAGILEQITAACRGGLKLRTYPPVPPS